MGLVSGMMSPVGPEAPNVYWVRRGAVVLVALSVVIGLILYQIQVGVELVRKLENQHRGCINHNIKTVKYSTRETKIILRESLLTESYQNDIQ